METNIPDEPCWSLELQPIPGLVLDEEICNYWIDKESFLETFEYFILNTKEQSKLLSNMMVDNNTSDMKKLLHKLKGSVKLYGAKRLFEIIKKFEDALATDNPPEPLKIKAEFDDAVQEITAELTH